MALDSYVIERVRKKKKRELDIRPLVHNITAEGYSLYFDLISFHGKAGVGPREILQHAVLMEEEEILLARVKKTSVADFSAST